MDPDHKTILEARNLRKVFGGLVAVDDVNIDIQEYSLHSIIGPKSCDPPGGKSSSRDGISPICQPTRLPMRELADPFKSPIFFQPFLFWRISAWRAKPWGKIHFDYFTLQMV